MDLQCIQACERGSYRAVLSLYQGLFSPVRSVHEHFALFVCKPLLACFDTIVCLYLMWFKLAFNVSNGTYVITNNELC